MLIHSEPSVNIQHPDFTRLQIVKEFRKQPLRLTESYNDNGKKMLGTVAPVGHPDWGVVVQKPEERAFASVDKMIRATIEWGGIALLLAIIAAVAFASGIARPIRLLADRSLSRLLKDDWPKSIEEL